MSKKIVVMKRVPSYNKYFSEPFKMREGDKFIVKENKDQYYVLFSIRLKKQITLLKTYFKDEILGENKKQIQYD